MRRLMCRALAGAGCALMFATSAGAVVNPPVLKWSKGGCDPQPFCDTGWYSSPAVADLDNDGMPEVIWGGYDVVVLNGETGTPGSPPTVQWRANSGQRVWPAVAVADLTGDGSLEVIVGRGGDQVTVYNSIGGTVWMRNPFGSGEVRTLAVDDLESDGQLEVIVGRASGGSDRQINVFEANGNVRAGFPARRAGEQGFGWGMYNENVAVGDLDGDGTKEIIGPTDTHYITAVDRNGNQLMTHSMFNAYNPVGPKTWARVGVHVDLAADLRGFANCGSEHRPNFANTAPAIADMDGDGTPEIVVVGDVYNCGIGDPAGDLYHLPWIFKRDRSRWSNATRDWTVIPTAEPGSGPLSQDFNVIENSVQNTVLADLDNDGEKEILYASYDGRLHAFWLDKTEHGSWPFKPSGSGIRFVGEPVVADLDDDGFAEILLTSWPQKGGTLVGQFHILNHLGVQIQAIDLPPSSPTGEYNGGLAAPTLANIDGDSDLEAVVGTVNSGVVAYDLPGTANARILWGTGRGGLRRTGRPTITGPTLDIDDVTVTESGSGTNAVFTVTLAPTTSQTVTVSYTTQSGTAASGSDFTATSGVLTFDPTEGSVTITVPILVDTLDENTETFTVRLSGATGGAFIGDGTGVGTIQDDDPMPFLSIGDAVALEGASGNTPAAVNVTLSTVSGRTVTVPYATGLATAPGAASASDFVAATGTLTIPAGTLSAAITTQVRGDLVDEPNETYFLNLGAPTAATLLDGQGEVGIIDDDGRAGLCIPILSLPYVITAQGNYCLNRNLSTSITSGAAITINSDFVSLDLRGFKIGGGGAGLGTQASGVFAQDRKNIRIRNGNIRGFLRGVYLRDTGGAASQGHVVEGIRADENTYIGIDVEGRGSVVRSNQVVKTTGTTTFGANANAAGIRVAGAGARVLNNDVSDTLPAGTGSGAAVVAELSTGAVIERNRIGNSILVTSVGVAVLGGSNVLVVGNRLSTLDQGVFFGGSAGSYRGNLTSGVTTPYTGGTDAGNNN